MDSRILKSGKIRLRFKLNEESIKTVNTSTSLVDYKYLNTSIEMIALSFLSGFTSKCTEKAGGSSRFLVRLYPDQYEVVLAAIEEAKGEGYSEEDALFHMCSKFIEPNS